MPEVRIYRPAKNAMQSGRANSRRWVVEFAPGDRKEPDPLMGWNGSRDTRGQVRMTFETQDEAVAFAKRSGYTYVLTEDRASAPPVPKNYADNFKFDRVG
ncbi:MAG TPA: ETC complex I subunit [Rhodospirillaceae bacterium]|nr:ETC complex I subunit [Rhodospirillaceae bacterium]